MTNALAVFTCALVIRASFRRTDLSIEADTRHRAAPGGRHSDILARLIGAKLTESWGQQIIADNRAGANGNIGAGADGARRA
jgi:tripartite-type tricarboxylate transporter receptor subunit TctC